jgi:hypothetical protein
MFCELLNTIAGSMHASTIGDILNLNYLGCDWSKVGWKTQVTINGGRCDLVGKNPSSAYIIVECKIGAGFTMGATGLVEDHQLRRYSGHLAAQPEKQKALVVVSLYSVPDSSAASGVRLVSWRDVARELVLFEKKVSLENSSLSAQLKWMLNFMRGHSMEAIHLEARDIVCLESWNRLESSCQYIGVEILNKMFRSNEEAKKAIRTLDALGMKMPNSYGHLAKSSIFSGKVIMLLSADKGPVVADDSSLLLWVGVQMSEAHGIDTTIKTIPEFTATIVRWTDKETFGIAQDILDSFLCSFGGDDWKLVSYGADNVVAIKKALPFTQVYKDDLDWAKVAESFYSDVFSDLNKIDTGDWVRLIQIKPQS